MTSAEKVTAAVSACRGIYQAPCTCERTMKGVCESMLALAERYRGNVAQMVSAERRRIGLE